MGRNRSSAEGGTTNSCPVSVIRPSPPRCATFTRTGRDSTSSINTQSRCSVPGCRIGSKTIPFLYAALAISVFCSPPDVADFVAYIGLDDKAFSKVRDSSKFLAKRLSEGKTHLVCQLSERTFDDVSQIAAAMGHGTGIEANRALVVPAAIGAAAEHVGDACFIRCLRPE